MSKRASKRASKKAGKKEKAPRTVAEQIAEECIAARLRALARVVTRIFNQALRSYGLTINQMNILAAVSYLGQARGQDVCRALHLEKSTLSRDLERMRANGWIESLPGDDGRTSLLRVTPAGGKLLEKTAPAWRQAQQEAEELLGKEHSAGLARAAAAVLHLPTKLKE
jgi:DNA-binding MarR family transcriptional regulator